MTGVTGEGVREGQAGVALSPKRGMLCSRENAIRVADRLLDELDGAVAVLRTTDPLQPFRVCGDPATDGEVVAIVTL